MVTSGTLNCLVLLPLCQKQNRHELLIIELTLIWRTHQNKEPPRILAYNHLHGGAFFDDSALDEDLVTTLLEGIAKAKSMLIIGADEYHLDVFT